VIFKAERPARLDAPTDARYISGKRTDAWA